MGGRYRKVRIIETGEVYNSMEECAEAINGSVSGISAVISGRVRTHMGYTFALAGRSDKEKAPWTAEN